eukprot:6489691-Amphidinium_carterae.1
MPTAAVVGCRCVNHCLGLTSNVFDVGLTGRRQPWGRECLREALPHLRQGSRCTSRSPPRVLKLCLSSTSPNECHVQRAIGTACHSGWDIA